MCRELRTIKLRMGYDMAPARWPGQQQLVVQPQTGSRVASAWDVSQIQQRYLQPMTGRGLPPVSAHQGIMAKLKNALRICMRLLRAVRRRVSTAVAFGPSATGSTKELQGCTAYPGSRAA
jgi:hypothetical protein